MSQLPVDGTIVLAGLIHKVSKTNLIWMLVFF